MGFRPPKDLGGSIFHDGGQNKMKENLPRGHFSIWYFDPGVSFQGGQNTI